MSEHKLIVLKVFRFRHEAEMAKGLLEDKGIPSLIQADDCGGNYQNLSMGNVRLLVSAPVVEDARQVLQVLEQE